MSVSTGLSRAEHGRTSVPPGMLPPPPPSPAGTVSIGAINRAGEAVKTYGVRASAADMTAISGVVQDYFRALAARNYVKACTMLSGASLTFISKEGARAGLLHGKRCESALPVLFKLSIFQGVSTRLEGLAVSEARVRGLHGFAVLSTKSSVNVEAYFPTSRVTGLWKLDTPTPLALQVVSQK